MAVAERLYYNDAFLRTFTARVSDIREYARTDGQSQWQIALDRTAFYPTSGGQPCDRGTLTAFARSGTELVAEIEDVVEDELGEVWHSTRKPLLAGTEVTGTIDWGRRLDHIQQHSGQHLLSAIFAEELGARTLSFHLGEKVCSVELEVVRAEQQAAWVAAFPLIERRVNEQIAADLPVTLHTVSAQGAQALLAAGKVRKLPLRAGQIRLVEIPELDLNACGGTHVHSLGQIGGLLLRGSERMKKGLRVEFVCGLRAVSAAARDFTQLSGVAAALSVGREATGAAVDRLLHDARAAAKTQQKLREELAHYHAVRLAVEERIDQGLRLVARSFPDRDAEYVRLLASRLIATVPQTAAIFLSTVEQPATLVLASSRSLDYNCGHRLRDALAPLGLRGGGSSDMAQVTLTRVQAEEIAEQLRSQLVREFRPEHEISNAS